MQQLTTETSTEYLRFYILKAIFKEQINFKTVSLSYISNWKKNVLSHSIWILFQVLI